MLVLIRVDGILYRPITDLRAIKAAIVHAVRSGGAFVPFLARTGVTEVFITSSTAIRIERVEEEPPEPPEVNDTDSSFDPGDF